MTGAIILGAVSDAIFSRRAPICMFAIFFSACLSYFIAFEYQTMGEKTFAAVMFFFGFFLGSLHHLINITCSADLGRQV